MPSLGPMEVLVVLVVALQLGKALAELRRWSSDLQGELRDALEPDRDAQPQPEPQTPPEPPSQSANGGGAPDLHPSPSPDGGEVW
jgi:Sec-independent protein translocase protein TatA